MPKENRLRAQKDFQRVFKSGRRFETTTLKWIASKGDTKHSRFGVVISKKDDKLAVNRNLIRRRIKEILRASLPEITTSALDMVILCSPQTVSRSFRELKTEIAEGIRLLNSDRS